MARRDGQVAAGARALSCSLILERLLRERGGAG